MITSQITAPQYGYHRYGYHYGTRPRYLVAGFVGAGVVGLAAPTLGRFSLQASRHTVSVIRAAAVAATGIIPGATEVLQALNSWTWFRLVQFGKPEYVGAALANITGAVNIYIHRHKLSKFARDKYKDILDDIGSVVTPAISFGPITERSRDGRGATTLSQRASRSVRPGNRRRRCRSRNKSGKTCLRPRNHSGRHRFK